MILQTDLLIHTALDYALQDIRKKIYLISDMYSDVTLDPLLRTKYGQTEVDRLKKFLISKQIDISLEHKIEQAKFPSIAISLGAGQEDVGKAVMSDGFVGEDVDPGSLSGAYQAPVIVLGPVTPESYDELTGQINFGDDVTLTNVFDGQFVYDEVNKVFYEIKLVLDDKTLLIDAGSKPDLNGMTIRPINKVVRHAHKSIWCWENVTLTVASDEANEVMYLFTLVMYILGRYKKTLFEARNFNISTVSYGPITRLNSPDDPNIIFGRQIQVRGRVEHSWIESTDPLIEGIGHQLRLQGTVTPDSIMSQVSAQGWVMEEDP